MLDSSDRSGPHKTPSAREDVSSLPTAELSPNGASPRPAGTWAPNMPAERGQRVASGPLSRPRPASGPNRGLVQVALPPRPSSLADTELDPLFLEELALKIAANLGTITGSALAERLKLPLAGVVEHLVAALRRENYIETVGGGTALMGGAGMNLRVTERGTQRSHQYNERSQYTRPPPVPVAHFR